MDHDDLCALLERYDMVISAGPSKAGSGISHFVTRENFTNGGKTVGFWVIRSDMTETDFSFLTAVSRRVKNPDAEFLEACRESVCEIVAAAKAGYFGAHGDPGRRVACEITGG